MTLALSPQILPELPPDCTRVLLWVGFGITFLIFLYVLYRFRKGGNEHDQ